MALTEPFEGAMMQAPQGLNGGNKISITEILTSANGTEGEIEKERGDGSEMVQKRRSQWSITILRKRNLTLGLQPN